jgi:hypothetical protein
LRPGVRAVNASVATARTSTDSDFVRARSGTALTDLITDRTSAGHGMAKPTCQSVAERADMLAFIEGAMELAPARRIVSAP